MKLKVSLNGAEYDVEVEVAEEPLPTLGSIMVGATSAYGVTPSVVKAPATSANALAAPMAGTVIKVLVQAGDDVTAGQTLLVLEAMKMETEVTAPKDGKVKSVNVAAGDPVQGGQVMIEWDD